MVAVRLLRWHRREREGLLDRRLAGKAARRVSDRLCREDPGRGLGIRLRDIFESLLDQCLKLCLVLCEPKAASVCHAGELEPAGEESHLVQEGALLLGGEGETDKHEAVLDCCFADLLLQLRHPLGLQGGQCRL